MAIKRHTCRCCNAFVWLDPKPHQIVLCRECSTNAAQLKKAVAAGHHLDECTRRDGKGCTCVWKQMKERVAVWG